MVCDYEGRGLWLITAGADRIVIQKVPFVAPQRVSPIVSAALRARMVDLAHELVVESAALGAFETEPRRKPADGLFVKLVEDEYYNLSYHLELFYALGLCHYISALTCKAVDLTCMHAEIIAELLSGCQARGVGREHMNTKRVIADYRGLLAAFWALYDKFVDIAE